MENDDVMNFINSLGEEKLEALANFLTDYEMLKGWQKLKQDEVAKNAGTTQSAISRLERMKGKPAYDLLQRVSKAVNGSLFLTPMGDVTVTLPYDLQERARKVAEAHNMTVRNWMNRVLRDNIEKAEYVNQNQQTGGLLSLNEGEYQLRAKPSVELEYSELEMAL